MKNSTGTMKITRLGCVPYLNAKPIIYGLETANAPYVKLLFAVPSKLAQLLSEGGINAAIMPSVELARHPEFGYLKGICISSKGAAESVIFWYKPPLERLRTVFLDPNSMTSNALLRIILKKKYNLNKITFIRREITPDRLPAGQNGCLMIGDRCLRQNTKKVSGINRMDLGREWFALTGLPFVFALWVYKNEPDRMTYTLLKESLQRGLKSTNAIARKESAVLGLPAKYCRDYLKSNIHYMLGRLEEKGLKKFLEMAE